MVMKYMPRISVIVPVYNVEKYLHRCVDSILGQTFTDFELILVDDGSPDNCGAICDEYAFKYWQVKVIHKEKNEGQSAARNSGLDAATGEYILFCDSDDAYDPHELKQMLKNLEDQPDAWYCFNYRNAWPDHVEEMMPYPQADAELNTVEKRMDFLSDEQSHKTMGYAVWDKMYSKKTIDQYHIRFPERDAMGNKDDWAEDLTFNLQYGMCVNRVHVDETPAYLLTKHGTPDQQHENGLIGRIDHMLNIMTHLQSTPAYTQSEACKASFWKIAIWHLKRYFFLEAGAKGMQGLRASCVQSPNWHLLKGWIQMALSEWDQFGKRWNDRDARDYRNMLEYLLFGNLAKYRIQSYWLWKIHPRFGAK